MIVQSKSVNIWIYTQYTDSEVITLYITTKLAEYLPKILKILVVKLIEPIHCLEDIQTNTKIIQTNCTTPRSKQIALPIGYIHEQFNL